MAKKLMSFRLAPDLADFLVDQSEVLGVSTTELVNRLLRWAVQNVPEGFFQAASLAPGAADISNLSTRKKEPPNSSKKPLSDIAFTTEAQNSNYNDSVSVKEYDQITEKAFLETKAQLVDEVKAQLVDEVKAQTSHSYTQNNVVDTSDDVSKGERTLVGNGI